MPAKVKPVVNMTLNQIIVKERLPIHKRKAAFKKNQYGLSNADQKIHPCYTVPILIRRMTETM